MTQPDRRDERLADERLAGLLHTQRATAKLLRESRGGYDPSWSDHMEAVADELERVASELLALREVNAKLEAYAESASEALLSVRPLGGSEMFTRFSDNRYLADPDRCKAEIERIRGDLHEGRLTIARLRKDPANVR